VLAAGLDAKALEQTVPGPPGGEGLLEGKTVKRVIRPGAREAGDIVVG